MHHINLQLFAEEGGAAADTGALASSTAETVDTDGMQAAPAEEQGEESFDDLIKGRYKQDYSRHVQEAISKRFKNQRDNQEFIDRMSPALNLMAERYGIQPDKDGNVDYDALYNKLVDDNSMYEEEAFKRGMSVEDLKHMKQLEFRNAQLQRKNDEAEREAQNRAEFEKLVQQGEELKRLYPNFDLSAEMQNPDFGRLIAVNVPVRTAFEVVHKDEILAGGMQYAVQQTAQKLSKAVQSGSRRARENGTSGQSASEVGTLDPSKLTLKDLQRIKARAERGERVTFT